MNQANLVLSNDLPKAARYGSSSTHADSIVDLTLVDPRTLGTLTWDIWGDAWCNYHFLITIQLKVITSTAKRFKKLTKK